MINNLPKHIVRLILLLLFSLLLALVAKSYLTDPSFYEYGHYRADTIPELAAGEPVYKGSVYCLECHEQRKADWSEGAHVAVQCEVCHGTNREVCLNPNQEHPESPKTTVPADTIRLCTTCHLALAARPAKHPQIILGQHPFPDEETPQCYTCHNPHSPSNMEPAGEKALPLGITESPAGLAEVVSKCARCHGKQGQGRNKTPALAGMQADVFIELMNNYKSGNSESKTMIKFASRLSDEEIAGLARYYEGLPVPAPD
ncbi:MAG: c-type cytochrome [Xanthomonadales bacterium]|nr:c-type cytochrome [Xanthomonadales bacterium]